MSEEKTLNIDATEAAIAEYAVEQYINKMQERIAEEHSGIARFMLESNIASANTLLVKVRAITGKPSIEANTELLSEPVQYDDLGI